MNKPYLWATMNSKDYKKICEAAIPVLKKTGNFILAQLNQVGRDEIERKGLNSLVSYVDKEAENMLVEGLGAILPDAGFITEENTVDQNKKEYTWIIDPLDGTSNFLHGIPHFAISVALMHQDQIVVGLIEDICKSQCYYASAQGGSFCEGQIIQVSETFKVSEALVATGFPYNVKDVAPLIRTLGYFMRYARGIRRYGAAALDLVYVASGKFDCYYESTLNSWDVAAGSLIVQEAGGKVSDFRGGEDYIFGREIIVANPDIHEAVQKIIKYLQLEKID